jgi:hypothetical protein
MAQPEFRVRIYSDHAIVNSEVLVSPLKNLGARLLEMAAAAGDAPVKKRRAKKVVEAAPVKKTRKPRKKKAVEVPPVNQDAVSGIEGQG